MKTLSPKFIREQILYDIYHVQAIKQTIDNQCVNFTNGHFSSFLLSDWLKRKVRFEINVVGSKYTSERNLLLLNDGQEIEALGVQDATCKLVQAGIISPLTVVAIHAGERKSEYGVAGIPDYLQRGAKARNYERFITDELLPHLVNKYQISLQQKRTFFAGCSLGGLSAFDIAVSNQEIFDGAGVFSGSFWWRSKGYDSGYTENDRIIFKKLKSLIINDRFKCWLMAGANDERNNRNYNGVIDSVNDTLDVFDFLYEKFSFNQKNIELIIAQGGFHNQATWKEYFPAFLIHAFGNNN